MAGTPKKLYGPAYLSATLTTNVYNNASSAVDSLIRHVHITNTTGTAATYTLYVSTTGDNTGGKELAKGISVAANAHADLYWPAGLRLASTDFIVGGSGTGSALTITISGELIAN